ncbi:uncharacterized protein LOC141900033 [Tubulanus polymorphus]|uniref:uncharacterized protein LOC141900033 n=1 Tax=Tubulanus polymorphus TaxID=672921 RepID=UPI003DA394B1
MSVLEEDFLQTEQHSPLLYNRFIDDIFIIWTHELEKLLEFHRNFTNFHPAIELSLEHSPLQIPFLDTLVKIINGKRETSLYRKPTDTYSYLHGTSFHPPHTTRSIVFSQAIRYHRICSNTQDRDQHLQQLKNAFHQLQHNPETIDQQITRATHIPRERTLQYKPPTLEETERIPIAVTYSPHLRRIQRIISDLQPIIEEDDHLRDILPLRPVIAYRQPANLRKLLISSKLSTEEDSDNNYTRPCNKSRCQLCPLINSSPTVTAANNQQLKVTGPYTCDSTNVVYAITCDIYPGTIYIGETGQTLRQRLNGHKFDIRQKKMDKPIGEHFNLPNHTISNLKVTALHKMNTSNKHTREIMEQKLVQRGDTVNLGLNRDLGFMSHYRT